MIFFRPEHVRYVLTENPRNFTNREVAESLRQLLGDGLITLDAFIDKLIAQRRAEGRDLGDVLSMILAAQQEGEMLTDTQVRDHIMTFAAAGHETTALALTWTFYLLSQHSQVREKLLAELQTVLGDRLPPLEDIPHLTYTEWVLNESMRLYPPAWSQGRRATEAFELDGYLFPAGTMVMFTQWVIHRLPDIWGDPEVFRPERWDPVNGQKVPPWSYFPADYH